jgi:hypothetical protein
MANVGNKNNVDIILLNLFVYRLNATKTTDDLDHPLYARYYAKTRVHFQSVLNRDA